MTVYGYARVSVREPEDKNLDLQVERLVRTGFAIGNIRAEGASGAKNDRRGLLELLDLVVAGDTLVVTHIDRLSRGLTYGLQVIGDLHLRGVACRSLTEDFNTSMANGKLQLTMVLAFSEWWRNSIRERSIAGQHKARAEGRFPGRPTVLTERQKEYVREELAKGVSQRELARTLEVSRWKIQQLAR
ncbi:MAG: recombinase family protein [Chloroflexota bacterium]|nr:recombinase family protein [Chloroflexota bacterium]